MNSNTVFITDNQRKYAEAEMEAFEWVKRKGAGGLRGREREGRVERERRETRDGWTDSSGLSRWSGLFGSSGLFSDPANQTAEIDTPPRLARPAIPARLPSASQTRQTRQTR